jgi:energy-coupling factor transporter ATP-binding protein EcfA2
MSLIVLNGPPGSGKTTASWIIKGLLPNCSEYSMAGPLKKAVHEVLGLDVEQVKWFMYYKDSEMKFLLKGRTPREMYIHMSETFLKPLLGKDVFGIIANRKIAQMIASNVVIPDCGFDDEIIPMIDNRVKGDTYCIVLTRKGCNYDFDSRSDLSSTTLNKFKAYVTIDNNHEMELFEAQISRTLKRFKLL